MKSVGAGCQTWLLAVRLALRTPSATVHTSQQMEDAVSRAWLGARQWAGILGGQSNLSNQPSLSVDETSGNVKRVVFLMREMCRVGSMPSRISPCVLFHKCITVALCKHICILVWLRTRRRGRQFMLFWVICQLFIQSWAVTLWWDSLKRRVMLYVIHVTCRVQYAVLHRNGDANLQVDDIFDVRLCTICR